MEFKNFEGNYQELVGKTVLHETGFTYSTTTKKYLRKIVKVTKTGFRIEGVDSLFSFDGRQKGLSGSTSTSKCKLLTEEKANELRIKSKEMMELAALREKMKIKLETMTLEQLKLMEQL